MKTSSQDLSNSLGSERKGYRSRFDLFWNTINWQLPDSVLASIWCVDRGNLRARRVRLGRSRPKWHVMQDNNSPVFKAATSLEKLKARSFSGLKPGGLTPKLKDANIMKIPVEISLEIIQTRDDGNLLMDLQARVLGQKGRYLNADIDAEDGLMQPRIISSSDTLGLGRADRDAFLTAAFGHMTRFFGSGPTGGTIKWARWVEVDLMPWLQQVLYRPTASRICRALQAHSKPEAAGIGRSFTESLEA